MLRRVVDKSINSLMPSTLTSQPRSKTATVRSKRFNPYARPLRDCDTSSNTSIAPIVTPLTRAFALYFDGGQVEHETVSKDRMLAISDYLNEHSQLNTHHLWMGSAMHIDEPSYTNGTSGSAQGVPIPSINLAGDEVSNIIPLVGSRT